MSEALFITLSIGLLVAQGAVGVLRSTPGLDLLGSSTSLYKQRVSPNGRTGRQDITSSIDVSIKNKPTVYTFVDANRKLFTSYDTTSATDLTRATWVNSNDFASGTLSLETKPTNEISPSSISYFFSSNSSRETKLALIQVQILDEDRIVFRNKSACDCNVLFSSEISNTSMLSCEQTTGFLAPFRFQYSSCNTSVSTFDNNFSFSKRLGALENITVACGSEMCDAEIDTNFTTGRFEQFGGDLGAGKNDVPTSVAAEFDVHRFYDAFNRTVSTKFDLTKERNFYSSTSRNERSFTGVFEGHNGERTPSFSSFESRVAWLFTGLAALEKSFEGTVKMVQRTSQDKDRNVSYVFSRFPYGRELLLLVNQRDVETFFSPGVSSFFETGIVKLARKVHPMHERSRLRFGWIEPVSERSNQDLFWVVIENTNRLEKFGHDGPPGMQSIPVELPEHKEDHFTSTMERQGLPC